MLRGSGEPFPETIVDWEEIFLGASRHYDSSETEYCPRVTSVTGSDVDDPLQFPGVRPSPQWPDTPTCRVPSRVSCVLLDDL